MKKSKQSSLKSSVDLVMERLARKEGSLRPLSDEQKSALAEVDRTVKAGIAESEIMYQKKIAAVQDDPVKVDELKNQQCSEINKIKAKGEEKKERIRDRG